MLLEYCVFSNDTAWSAQSILDGQIATQWCAAGSSIHEYDKDDMRWRVEQNHCISSMIPSFQISIRIRLHWWKMHQYWITQILRFAKRSWTKDFYAHDNRERAITLAMNLCGMFGHTSITISNDIWNIKTGINMLNTEKDRPDYCMPATLPRTVRTRLSLRCTLYSME